MIRYQWNRLDNAAKIFPTACYKTDTQVFRFSCELDSAIDQETLQKALERTLGAFQFYQRTLKRGLFWYYLEASDIRSVVREEYKPICSPLYFKNRKRLLFEVTYFRSRINLEVHHALSDGTGAMLFLKRLVSEYLRLKLGTNEPAPNFDASPEQMADDSFIRHYEPEKPRPGKTGVLRAYKLHGAKLPDTRLRAITAYMSVKAVLAEAHKYGATLTSYLTAQLMMAIGEDMTAREKKRKVIICVPVNLRNYFSSKTLRNFFGALYVAHDFSREASFEDIVSEASESIKSMLTTDHLLDVMNGYLDIENNIFAKMAPLRIKDFVLRIAYKRGYQWSTAGFSNLGRAELTGEAAKHARAVSVLSGTDALQLCACSLGDTLTIGMTSPFASPEVQRRFLRRLSDAGIDIEITANEAGEGGAER